MHACMHECVCVRLCTEGHRMEARESLQHGHMCLRREAMTSKAYMQVCVHRRVQAGCARSRGSRQPCNTDQCMLHVRSPVAEEFVSVLTCVFQLTAGAETDSQ